MARAAISRGGRGIRDFVERVCRGYSSLLPTQTSSYRDRLNAFLADAQAHEEYIGGYCVRLGERSYTLHVDDADSVEKVGFHPAFRR